MALPPATVIQRSAQRAVLDGFTVTVSDANAGILSAELKKSGGGDWGTMLKCGFQQGSIAHNYGAAVLTLKVTAQASATGSDVVIATTTHYEGNSPLGRDVSDTKCASSGEIEAKIAKALATP